MKAQGNLCRQSCRFVKKSLKTLGRAPIQITEITPVTTQEEIPERFVGQVPRRKPEGIVKNIQKESQ